MEKEKIVKKRQTDRFPGLKRILDTEKQYSVSESGNNMINLTQKYSHYKFVVDWQLNDDRKLVVE